MAIETISESAPLSPAAEKRAAKELSPGVAWPTLALAVVLPAATIAVVWLGLARVVPLWICTIVLSYLAYAHYTLVHEATHDNLVPAHPKLRWISTLVGWERRLPKVSIGPCSCGRMCCITPTRTPTRTPIFG